MVTLSRETRIKMAYVFKSDLGGTDYVLTLSPDEAKTLVAAYAKVGGCPSSSPRKHTQSVADALYGVGLHYEKDNGHYPYMDGGIICRDYPEPVPAFVPGYFSTDSRVQNSVIEWFDSDPREDGYYNAV